LSRAPNKRFAALINNPKQTFPKQSNPQENKTTMAFCVAQLPGSAVTVKPQLRSSSKSGLRRVPARRARGACTTVRAAFSKDWSLQVRDASSSRRDRAKKKLRRQNDCIQNNRAVLAQLFILSLVSDTHTPPHPPSFQSKSRNVRAFPKTTRSPAPSSRTWSAR
jgi:hypothetical protein